MTDPRQVYLIVERATFADGSAQRAVLDACRDSEVARRRAEYTHDVIERFHVAREASDALEWLEVFVADAEGHPIPRFRPAAWGLELDGRRFEVAWIAGNGKRGGVYAGSSLACARNAFAAFDVEALYRREGSWAEVRLIDSSPVAFGMVPRAVDVRHFGSRERSQKEESVRRAVHAGVLCRDEIKRAYGARDEEIDAAERAVGRSCGALRAAVEAAPGNEPPQVVNEKARSASSASSQAAARDARIRH